MILTWLSLAGLVLAIIPAATFLSNLQWFIGREEPSHTTGDQVSVLIPARDEEQGIADSVHSALASDGIEVEVIVLDDHSTDATAAIVSKIAEQEPRLRCLSGKPLPAGWNGKQHACWQLAEAANFPRLAFIDADVRLRPTALSSLVNRQRRTGVSLLSAFPHQQTGTFLEKLIIPLMHFILLGFLPLSRMRGSVHPAYAAGCGQLFLTGSDDYKAAGTHAAIAASRHDGLKLPRIYREAGLMTDVIDGADLAECRMYTSAPEVIRGVLKNATEGIASPKLIVPFSIVLLGGSLLPVVTVTAAVANSANLAIAISLSALIIGHLPRAVAAMKFRQSWVGVLLHSVSIALFVTLQWTALVNQLLGRQIAWRGRVETPTAS